MGEEDSGGKGYEVKDALGEVGGDAMVEPFIKDA